MLSAVTLWISPFSISAHSSFPITLGIGSNGKSCSLNYPVFINAKPHTIPFKQVVDFFDMLVQFLHQYPLSRNKQITEKAPVI